MGLREWWDRVAPPATAWDGRTGRPPSGNGASSFHLFWDAPAGRWAAAEVTVEVLRPPAVPKLCFWAMQVSFTDGHRSGGAGHVGPQGGSSHPGGTAINWGGYGPGGGELEGSTSPLPSASGNVNTRDYAWRPGAPYRLRVHPLLDPASMGAERPPAGLSAWRAEVLDVERGERTVIRELWAAGTWLESPMMWSEIFCDCDDPSVAVRWSEPTLFDADGRGVPITGISVNYQSLHDGGCANTSCDVDGRGVVQATNTARRVAQGARLQLPR